MIRWTVDARKPNGAPDGLWKTLPLELPNLIQRLLGIKFRSGLFVVSAQMDKSEALSCFDAAMADNGEFSIDIRDMDSVDFNKNRGMHVGIEFNLSAVQLYEAGIPLPGGRRLLELFYSDYTNADVLNFLKDEKAATVPESPCLDAASK